MASQLFINGERKHTMPPELKELLDGLSSLGSTDKQKAIEIVQELSNVTAGYQANHAIGQTPRDYIVNKVVESIGGDEEAMDKSNIVLMVMQGVSALVDDQHPVSKRDKLIHKVFGDRFKRVAERVHEQDKLRGAFEQGAAVILLHSLYNDLREKNELPTYPLPSKPKRKVSK